MNSKAIIGIVVMAVAVGAIISLVTDSREYADFNTAASNPEVSYEIVGHLDTTEAIVYDALKNADAFSFYMIDEEGTKRKVICSMAKPQDFEKSVQVVASGHMKDDIFYADNVLLKCPSKYEDSAGPPDFVKEMN